MLPRVFYVRKKIFRHYTGFSFFVFIWISELVKERKRLIHHETIHYRQQIELLFIFHWLLYGLFYVVSRVKGHEHYIAYRYNPFEIEAYRHDGDYDYLSKRKPFAWLKYLTPYLRILGRKRLSVDARHSMKWPDDGISFLDESIKKSES